MKSIFRKVRIFFIVIYGFIGASLITAPGVKAATVVYSVNWNSGFESYSWVETSCTALATCTTGRVNDTGVSANVLFVSAAGIASAQAVGYWDKSLTWQDMGVPVGATITQVNGQIQAKVEQEGLTATHIVNIFMFDSANTTNILQSDVALEPNHDPTPVGNWNTVNASGDIAVKSSYTDYNTTVHVRLGQTVSSGLGVLPTGEVRLHNLSITITYELPVYTQSNFRLFNNANSTDVGSALAAQNTNYQMTANGERFRLRQVLSVATAQSFANIDNFKLQFVDKGSGSCASPSGGTPSSYTDVTSSTAISYFDNSTPADGAALTANANDPTGSGTLTKFTYEEANNFTNSSAIAVGNSGMWDFSLYDNTALSGKTYCFRIVKSDGTVLSTYSQYAEVGTRPAALTIDIVDGSGISVASPFASFASFSQRAICKSNTGTLGTSTQKLRVQNTTTNPAWSLSIAATSGATSLWTNGTTFFDFNDPGPDSLGCVDHTDADSYGGQMTLNPSVATISPEASCTGTGITLGSSNKFNQGTTDSLTLASASGSTLTECYWDITDISLSTTLPGGLATGTYTLDFTLTIVAN